ncbi:MAG: signal peptide peptidase SppA [Verrucomicrobiota bacterium]|nr:signal peptide peptidase SppA [Verrucomicrobiota bacterium]
MKDQRFGCLGIGLVTLLVLSLLLNFAFLLVSSNSVRSAALLPRQVPKFEESLVVAGGGGVDDKIAVLSVRGLISTAAPGGLGESMVEDVKLQLKQAIEDSKVKAIVLQIESPGGEVTSSDSIYHALARAREKKPVVVSMGALAASGGYYIACGGSHLIANETTFTGSIGVIMQTINYEQLFGKVGLQMHTFKSGAFKDMLSGSRPMTEEEKQYLQTLVMQTYGKFVGIVAQERKLDEEQLRSGVADGRVVTGKDALSAKLIDQIGDVEAAYAKAMELGKAPGAAVIRYDAPFSLSRIFRIFTQSETKKIEVEIARALAPPLDPGKLYFLPGHYAP